MGFFFLVHRNHKQHYMVKCKLFSTLFITKRRRKKRLKFGDNQTGKKIKRSGFKKWQVCVLLYSDCSYSKENISPWLKKASMKVSNLLKKAAIISSLFNMFGTEVDFCRTAFKHVVGFSLSTFMPIPA